jgi:flap endonuclease-1
MGITFTGIVTGQPISAESLSGKVLVVDSYNMLYQFLSVIRQRDGSLLTDSKGRVTSHLAGLLTRITGLLEKGIKLVFVFDGKPPPLKKQEIDRRVSIKKEAQKKYEEAQAADDIAGMKKYAMRTSRLTPEMVDEAKALITGFGCPIIQAPSEGESQAAHMVKKGEAYAEVSEDYDCLLFGVPRMIKQLSFAGRRKQKDTFQFRPVQPEVIELDMVLATLGITHNQLIALGMIIGTDYNKGGIKGIGPKKALNVVKLHKENLDALFKEVKWNDFFPYPWKTVFDLFRNMEVTDTYSLQWTAPDSQAITSLLVDTHEFSVDRVNRQIESLIKVKSTQAQKGLGNWL